MKGIRFIQSLGHRGIDKCTIVMIMLDYSGIARIGGKMVSFIYKFHIPTFFDINGTLFTSKLNLSITSIKAIDILKDTSVLPVIASEVPYLNLNM